VVKEKDSPRFQGRLAGTSLAIALYAALAASYFVLRFAGQWSDSDTASLTAASRAVLEEGTLLPSREVYSLGFAYQSLTTLIVHISGLSLVQLQFWVYPLVAAALSLAAYVMYREFTASSVAGGLATLLLFLQPDFLFVVFRGSHEKVTWLVAMLALYALARSFRAAHRPAVFAIYVALFYVAAFCLIASNVFFGSSFVLAVALSLLAGLVLLRLAGAPAGREAERRTVIRLISVLTTTLVVWFLSVFYLYPPAAQILRELRGVLDRFLAVGLGLQPTFDPYAVVGWGWRSPLAYLGLMLPSFGVAGLSLLVWTRMGLRYLRRSEPLAGDPPRFLLWLLYGGFGVQMVIGVAIDRVGSFGGNLQHRLFPVVMLLAFPLVGLALTGLWQKSRATRRKAIVAAALTLFVVWSSAAALLKATNDPALSNYWVFWTVPEDEAVHWIDEHLQARSVWLGLDGFRLSSRSVVEGFGRDSLNRGDAAEREPQTRDIVLSQVDEALAVRRSASLANTRSENRVYDSGTVAIYHLRPRTPYQR
jgi:hypothetical protein